MYPTKQFDTRYGKVVAIIEPLKVTFRSEGDFNMNRIDCTAQAVYVFRATTQFSHAYNGWELRDYSNDGRAVMRTRESGGGMASFNSLEKWECLTQTLIRDCVTPDLLESATLAKYDVDIAAMEEKAKEMETELRETREAIKQLKAAKAAHTKKAAS